jgi:hypothetical protein
MELVFNYGFIMDIYRAEFAFLARFRFLLVALSRGVKTRDNALRIHGLERASGGGEIRLSCKKQELLPHEFIGLQTKSCRVWTLRWLYTR